MNTQNLKKVLDDPEFQQMAKQKAILGWFFSALMLFVYVIFILFIAFSPSTFATPVFENGVTTWGIYIGVFVILFAFVITGIYVFKVNGKYEDMTRAIVRKVQEK